MVGSLLIRGMLVGLVAGLLAFAFAYVFGEPEVQHAMDFENLLAARAHEAPGPELVSRGMQRTVGLASGTVAIGVALGGLFALAYAYAYGRIAVAGARATAAMLALAAYATITLVPFTKYPANPPTVGNAATIDKRTLLYFAMIGITALALVAAVRLRRQLRERLGTWNATIAAGSAFVALIAVAQLNLPAVHETPAGFPADVLYRFRLASLGVNATLWLTIGLGFGAVAERLLASDRRGLRTPGSGLV
jgi:Probable cobalt transporter subunit (CbtA)